MCGAKAYLNRLAKRLFTDGWCATKTAKLAEFAGLTFFCDVLSLLYGEAFSDGYLGDETDPLLRARVPDRNAVAGAAARAARLCRLLSDREIRVVVSFVRRPSRCKRTPQHSLTLPTPRRSS